MNRFLIITNKEKDKDYTVTKRIAAYIEKAGKQAVLSRVSAYQKEPDRTAVENDVDCAIVLGGDGTIIQAANDLIARNIPILGVNLGTVGFLAEIEEQHVLDELDRLFHDDFYIESRMMLQGDITCEQNHVRQSLLGYALNDIVISRKGFSRIITLGIYVNDVLVDNFIGDGAIISTPTGSTAYNLSAGGPIVLPEADVMVITPICPHSLSPRSVVVSAKDTIKVVIGKSKKTQEEEASASFDGQKEADLGTSDTILIKRAQYDTKLIRLNRKSIYEILRSKLGNNAG